MCLVLTCPTPLPLLHPISHILICHQNEVLKGLHSIQTHFNEISLQKTLCHAFPLLSALFIVMPSCYAMDHLLPVALLVVLLVVSPAPGALCIKYWCYFKPHK